MDIDDMRDYDKEDTLWNDRQEEIDVSGLYDRLDEEDLDEEIDNEDNQEDDQPER